jgi:hypothetical protein
MDPATPLTINRPAVIFDVQGDEAVVIDLTTGRYFRLDAPSTVLWQQFAAPATPAAVLASCTTPEVLGPAFDAIVSDLMARGLLRPAAGPMDADTGVPRPWRFEGFKLEEFTDLEDILGLDPIHEVDPEKGWPHAAPA